VSATLLADARTVTLEIADSRGLVRSYSIAPAPCGLADWACNLTRLDTERTHRVERALALQLPCVDVRAQEGRAPADLVQTRSTRSLSLSTDPAIHHHRGYP
jgi:hypothetical protein